MIRRSDLSQEHALFRETVRRFVEDRIRPRAREFDEQGMIDKALYREMGELGMLGLRYDEAYGGGGLDWTFTAVLHEELPRCDNFGVMTGIAVHADMATPSLHAHGSGELKRRFLAPAIAGEQVAAVAVTEPQAGSDVARITTRARRDGDDWVIDGSKVYITNAGVADWFGVLAVTDPDAGYGGYSQIIVPRDSPGLSVRLEEKIGSWGSDTGQVTLDGVRVPVANTIGEVGAGFKQQMEQFQDERLVACINVLGVAELLWDETKRWCDERVLFGTPLSKMQNTQFRMVEMLADIQAAKAFNNECVRELVEGRDATELISLAKIFVPRVARRVADGCLQFHGGYGYMKESMAGRAFVDTRLASIGGGTDETMMDYVARRLGF